MEKISAFTKTSREAPAFKPGEEREAAEQARRLAETTSRLYVKFVCDISSRMETIRTLACKLRPTAAQRTALDATLVAFAAACNHIAEVARQIHSTNKVKVQHACYREVRERFGLSANLTIRAIARVCAALKVPAKAHATFAPTSMDYDQLMCQHFSGHKISLVFKTCS